MPFSATEIHTFRADTPGCTHRIHLNNAGAALPPTVVTETLTQYIQMEANTGGYETAAMLTREIDAFYPATAALLGAQAHQIAFATNATDAYARALSAFDWRPDDVILTTNDDYVSNQLAFLSLQRRLGIRLIRAKAASEGGVDIADMERLIKTHHPKLVAVTHVPTNSGLVQPVEEVGRLCRLYNIWYLVDACQSAGQMPLDVEQMGCDFLTGTFRKFLRGPRGAGFLYVSDRALQAGLTLLYPDLRGATWVGPDDDIVQSDAKRFEYWEQAQALKLAAAKAAEYALSVGLDRVEKRVVALADYTRTHLAEIDGMRVLDRGRRRCGIVTCWAPDLEGPAIRQFLNDHHINTSVAVVESAQIDFSQKGVRWALRISPHYYNTPEEIDETMARLRQFIR